ncbi:hypothetical protein [Streptomyces sp. NPDC127098]|uniref:hypothetical protein n=1 Tax=Streptomyces sp. NPDC127098 TaxID=3347137 RepID=UPI003661D40C
MDQGIAAVLAGITGLLGAAIGGFAAAWGARIGAETAARASAQQVRDQAQVDHDHWLRGQRLEAWRALLARYDEYAIVASNMTRVLEGEISGSSGIGAEFGGKAHELTQAYFLVRLLGPDTVREAALQLRRGVQDHFDCVNEWTDVLLGMDGRAVAALQAEEEELRNRLGALHDALVEQVTGNLASAPSGR